MRPPTSRFTRDRVPASKRQGGPVKLLLAVAVALLAVPAMAATIAVNTTADELDFFPNGRCSLREAVVTVNEVRDVGVGGCLVTGGSLGNDDVIVLPAGLYRLTRLSALFPGTVDQDADNLDLLADVTIRGAGAAVTIIDGEDAYTPLSTGPFPLLEGGVVRVESGVSATMEGITLRHGSANHGGGVAVYGSLTLIEAAVEHNEASSVGGGIYNQGSLTLERVTVAENTAGQPDWPGTGGGIYSSGDLSATNSTISSNTASGGGGIFLGEASDVVILSSVTIANNVAPSTRALVMLPTGGLYSGAADVRVEATLIAGNEATLGSPDCQGTFASFDYNLIGDATDCTGFNETNDETGSAGSPIDPLLTALGNYGGDTRTHALRAGSPAIDGAGLGIVESCLAIDQRGEPRPMDGDGNGFTHCDVGAYEAAANSAPQANVAVVSLYSSPVDVVAAGGAVEYEVGVRNNGPDAATDVSYTLELPAGATPGALPAGCSVAGATISCVVGDLPAQVLNLETFDVTAPATTGVTIARVTVGASSEDPSPEDDVMEDTLTVVSASSSDLSLAMSGPSSVVRGENIEYLLTVSNAGPEASSDALDRVVNQVPSNTTFVSATAGCSRANNLVTCLLEPLAPGASRQLSIVVTAPNQLTTVTNTASVYSEDDDLIDNNSASFGTRVVDPPPPQADLFIQKLGPSTAEVGAELSYSLVVNNNGPEPATAVRVTDTLPLGATVTSLPAECSQEGRTITCDLGGLQTGDPIVSLPIVVTAPDSPGDILNSASVHDEGDSADPYPANDTSAVVTSITTEPTPPGVDLSLTKSAPATVLPGAGFRYTVTVTNQGTATAPNVVIADSLPEGVTYVNASAGCAYSGGTVECEVGDLASGASHVIAIDVTAPAAEGPLVNSARAASDADDVNPGDEEDTAATTVSASPPQGSASLTITANAAGADGQVGPNDDGVVMLSFTATAGASEGVSVGSLAVSATGNAGAQGIARVALYSDEDGDGAADDGTAALAIGTFAAGAKETELVLARPELIAAAEAASYVVTVDFGEQSAGAPEEPGSGPWFVLALLLGSPMIFTRMARRGASKLLVLVLMTLVLAGLTSCFTAPGNPSPSYQLRIDQVTATGSASGLEADVQGLPLQGRVVGLLR